MSGVALVPGKSQLSDANGAPLAGGTVDVYLAGTTTRTNSWQDQALTTLNTNPIVLDASGSCSMWLDGSTLYKIVVKNATGAVQSHLGGDNISGASGSTSFMTFLQSGVGAVSRNAQAKMREFKTFGDFGAVGDGVTDDTAAIKLARDSGHKVFVAVGSAGAAFALTEGIDFGAGVTIIGLGNHPNYVTFSTTVTDHPCRFVKTNKNTTNNYTLKLGKNCELIGVSVLGPQTNYNTPVDGAQWLGKAGTYPADTTNPDYGVFIYGQSVRLERVAVMNFGEAGIWGDDTAPLHNAVCTFESVGVTACKRGIYGTFYDSTFANCFVTQCVEANVEITAPATVWMGGRIEWAAYKGISVKGAGFQLIGATVDRNGGPGVEIRDTFGATISAFITRNGCGGDGTSGRYGGVGDFGHWSYRATSDTDSANVKLNGAQVVTVHGCRFSAGRDDAGTGANAPAYNVVLVDGGIPTVGNNVFQSNTGDGFAASYPVSSGAPAYFNDTTKVGAYVSTQPLQASQMTANSYFGTFGGKIDLFETTVAVGAVAEITGKPTRYIFELLDTGRSGHAAFGHKGFDTGAFFGSVGDFNYQGNNITLSGGTGTAGKINIASNDNSFFIENRTAAPVSLAMFIRSGV